jgi:putative N6-adenine-specific DNA methylase
LGAINDYFSKIEKKNKECIESKTGQLILVRIVNDKCTISIDSSGDPLYKRGYKLAVAKAPLRENIASAVLLFSGWDGESPIIDPFCGSGTIPIEAAMKARHYAPGLDRRFQFFSWPCFDKKGWDSMLAASRDKINPKIVSISGFDRDAGAIKMAEENANRWTHNHSIEFINQALSYMANPGFPGVIVTNPPYGVRIKENTDLRNLYARFGTLLKANFTGWTIVLLSPDDRLTANLALGDPESELSFQNGGIKVKMLKYQI